MSKLYHVKTKKERRVVLTHPRLQTVYLFIDKDGEERYVSSAEAADLLGLTTATSFMDRVRRSRRKYGKIMSNVYCGYYEDNNAYMESVKEDDVATLESFSAHLEKEAEPKGRCKNAFAWKPGLLGPHRFRREVLATWEN